MRTGTEAPNGHVTIAFVNGTAFNGQIQNQRAALALINGYVYITWSSHCDGGAYHGFIAAYSRHRIIAEYIASFFCLKAVAAFIILKGQSLANHESALLYLTAFFSILMVGPGRISVDGMMVK